MTDVDLYNRLRLVERDLAVHAAICAERHRGISVRLNVIMVGVAIIMTAVAAGDPLVALLRAALVR